MRKKLFSNRLEVCFDPDRMKILRALAKKYRKTMNEIIREAIDQMGSIYIK